MSVKVVVTIVNGIVEDVSATEPVEVLFVDQDGHYDADQQYPWGDGEYASLYFRDADSSVPGFADNDFTKAREALSGSTRAQIESSQEEVAE